MVNTECLEIETLRNLQEKVNEIADIEDGDERKVEGVPLINEINLAFHRGLITQEAQEELYWLLHKNII